MSWPPVPPRAGPARARSSAVVLATALLLVACGADGASRDLPTGDAGGDGPGAALPPVPVVGGDGVVHELELTGGAEFPGPGVDVDAPLLISVTIRPSDATAGTPADVCVGAPAFAVPGLADLPGDLTGIHLHEAGVGAAGPVVVDLAPVADAVGTDGFLVCVEVDDDVATRLLADPAGHYLNVHTSTYPDGAVRDQLA